MCYNLLLMSQQMTSSLPKGIKISLEVFIDMYFRKLKNYVTDMTTLKIHFYFTILSI